jgi:Kdo2-lipid IVA lauroyltransferase/acyltransferase
MAGWRRSTKSVRHWLLLAAARAGLRFFGLLPMAVNVRVGALLGWLVSHLARSEFRRTLRHLDLALGDELSSGEKRRLARRCFIGLGISLFEVFSYRRVTPETAHRYFRVTGLERYRKHLAAGKGTILIGGHLGNWEFSGAFFPLHGMPFHVIVRENPHQGLAELVYEIRRFWGETIYHRSPFRAARAALEVLRQGETVAILMDQDTSVDHVFVPFFGRLAATPSGPAALAVKLGSPVFPVFIEREGPCRHHVRIEGPLYSPAEGSREERIVEFTAQLTARIEAEIRRRPEDWVWMHRRWRRQPNHEGTPSTTVNHVPKTGQPT